MVKGRRHPSWSWKLFMLQLQVQLKIDVFVADCLNFALDYKGYDKNNKKLKQKNNLKFKLQLKLLVRKSKTGFLVQASIFPCNMDKIPAATCINFTSQ